MSQFYVWDENNVNIQNSTDFLNDNQRKNGFVSGTPASSSRTNTALRQATLITAALMEMLTVYRDNNALTVQSSINDVKQAILNGFKNFEATDMTVNFTSASNREALTSGETLSISIGKISSWLSALKALAFKATVSTSDIVNSAITTDKLANSAVTTGKIVNNAVTSAKLASNSVTTVKIADNTISNTKIANGAITTDKLASNAITSVKIAAKAITTEKFADAATCPRATSDADGRDISTSYARLPTYTYNSQSETYIYPLGTVIIAEGYLGLTSIYLGLKCSLYCNGRTFKATTDDRKNVAGLWLLTSMADTAAGLDYATFLFQRVE